MRRADLEAVLILAWGIDDRTPEDTYALTEVSAWLNDIPRVLPGADTGWPEWLREPNLFSVGPFAEIADVETHHL